MRKGFRVSGFYTLTIFLLVTFLSIQGVFLAPRALAQTGNISQLVPANSLPISLDSIYQSNNYRPIWLHTPASASLLKELEELVYDGLDTNRYQLSQIRQLCNNKGKNTLPIRDTLFTHAYLQAAHDLMHGTIDPQAADKNWHHPDDHNNHEPDIIKGIAQNGTYVSLDRFRSKIALYKLLRTTCKDYIGRDKENELALMVAAMQKGERQADSVVSGYLRRTRVIPIVRPQDILDTNSMLTQLYKGYKGTVHYRSYDSTFTQHKRDSLLQLITINMERLRWMPQAFAADYVAVYIPQMELQLVHNKQTAMRMKVILGRSSRETPDISEQITNVILNPSWTVPPGITKNDIMPGVSKSGASYLSKKGLVVIDRKTGEVVNSSVVNSSNYRQYLFRQPPGDGNALGKVKFNMQNQWNIYLHDTPSKPLFDRDIRTFSSGCIRLEHPRKMAVYILSDMDGQDMSNDKLDSLIDLGTTRSLPLKHKIPVHTLYLTAAYDSAGTAITFARDIYKKDAVLIRLLTEQKRK